jgi:glutamate-1-semialdehyde 2,1-aminomutase
MTTWQQNEADLAFIERDLNDFLPDQIFDAHAHLFAHTHYLDAALPASLAQMPDVLGMAEYRRYIEWVHPGNRTKGGLFFGLVFLEDRAGNNDFIRAEIDSPDVGEDFRRQCFGQLVVAPDDDLELIRAGISHERMVGLKCYHTMADVDGPTFEAPIEAYLPEAQVQLAHEEGLTITLHMVRERALADPVNQSTIRRYCETYPNMRLILAHAARGFNPWHTIEGIHSLEGLDNVWFDTSAVTEAGAFEAIVDVMGHERLLYGTDFPVSHMRGRCVAIGDSFHWIYDDELDLGEKHTTLQPVLVGLESLRALRLACWRLKLSDSQINDIFYWNALRLLDV